MREKGKILCYGCLSAVLLLFGVWFLTKITNPGYGDAAYKDFSEDSERYEVLFFGNSHMKGAVYPMELWRDQGIVSYNMAGLGNPLPATYWRLKMALQDVSPKVVVIECYRMKGDKKIDNKERLHVQTDPMPFTFEKMRMIDDLLEKPEDRLEFIWNFAAYHERWQELGQKDFQTDIGIGKGGGGNYGVVPPGEMVKKPAETVGFTSVGTEYLRRMIEECQSRDIEVLLTYLPFPDIDGGGWQEAFCMERIAEEYGICAINFLDLQVADFETDCYDSNSHLNVSGGRKVTKYLGQYLAEHYDVRDHRGEEEYAGWDEDYRQYTANKLKMMAELESLDKMLVMLADPSFDCCIYVNGETDIWRQNELYQPLLENIAGWRTEKLAQAAAQGSNYLLVVENQGGGVFEIVDDEELPKECSLGELSYQVDENGGKCLCLQDRTGRKHPESAQEGAAAVTVFVADRQGDGSVLCKQFAVDVTMNEVR